MVEKEDYHDVVSSDGSSGGISQMSASEKTEDDFSHLEEGEEESVHSPKDARVELRDELHELGDIGALNIWKPSCVLSIVFLIKTKSSNCDHKNLFLNLKVC